MNPDRRDVLLASLGLVVGGGLPQVIAADAVRLSDAAKVGDRFAYTIDLVFRGKMTIDNGGKPTAIPIEAMAKHNFIEQLEAVDAGTIGKTIRHYRDAVSESATGVERSKRHLPTERATIAVQRSPDGTTHYHPQQPLSRDELALVAEHFDTLCLPNLLSNKDTQPGETWAIPNETVQAACVFDGLIKHDWVGKLLEVTGEKATFEITGSAEGIEHGAIVKIQLAAKGVYSRSTRTISLLTWEQTDKREQGPISPAIEAKATITITRTPTTEQPPALAAVKLPSDGKIPELLTQLRLADVAGRYELLHSRDWHIVVQSDKHLVLRLLARGELIAQATIAEWKPTMASDEKGVIAEFVEATRKQAGWQPEKVLENGPISGGAGRQLYRLSASGTQDGLPVVQSFHLLSGATGVRLAVTIQSPAAAANKVGTRDVALVTAIEFIAKK